MDDGDSIPPGQAADSVVLTLILIFAGVGFLLGLFVMFHWNEWDLSNKCVSNKYVENLSTECITSKTENGLRWTNNYA